MKPYSNNLRRKIVGAYESGNHSLDEVADLFGVSLATVKNFVRRKRLTGSSDALPHAECSRSTIGFDLETSFFHERLLSFAPQHHFLDKLLESYVTRLVTTTPPQQGKATSHKRNSDRWSFIFAIWDSVSSYDNVLALCRMNY
jgi:transposase-like protein